MRVASLLVVASLLAACETDLGQCDMAAATQVVYSADGTPYHDGQALVQQSCAGNYCHVSSAVGASRFGAPHGLDFDVTVLTPTATQANVSALRTGLANIHDEAHSMYGEIEGGSMPPGKVGERPVQTWTRADKTVVPLDIRTDSGKATVRNWLACGAPAVAGVTGAPADAMALGSVLPQQVITVGKTFQSVYESVLKGSCVSCHIAGGAFADLTPLDFSTQTAAYATLVNKDTSPTGDCAGRGKLVAPNSCMTSLLYQKLLPVTAPAKAVCGAPMPMGGAAIASNALMAVCDWINAGALQ
jgi:mono/diheme cytochrome c family protein